MAGPIFLTQGPTLVTTPSVSGSDVALLALLPVFVPNVTSPGETWGNAAPGEVPYPPDCAVCYNATTATKLWGLLSARVALGPLLASPQAGIARLPDADYRHRWAGLGGWLFGGLCGRQMVTALWCAGLQDAMCSVFCSSTAAGCKRLRCSSETVPHRNGKQSGDPVPLLMITGGKSGQFHLQVPALVWLGTTRTPKTQLRCCHLPCAQHGMAPSRIAACRAPTPPAAPTAVARPPCWCPAAPDRPARRRCRRRWRCRGAAAGGWRSAGREVRQDGAGLWATWAWGCGLRAGVSGKR